MNQYYIMVVTIDNTRATHLVDVAFQASKGKCAMAFNKNSMTALHMRGQFSDYVRVLSAIRNNNFVVLKSGDAANIVQNSSY